MEERQLIITRRTFADSIQFRIYFLARSNLLDSPPRQYRRVSMYIGG